MTDRPRPARPDPMIAMEPITDHVRQLHDHGLTQERISALSGVPVGIVEQVLHADPPISSIRFSLAHKLLAVHPSTAAPDDDAMITGRGLQRRCQALMALGWSPRRIADAAHVDRADIQHALLAHPLPFAIAHNIVEAYQHLSNHPPTVHTPGQQAAATRARNHARLHRFAPPAAWDDDTIDQDDARPQGITKTSRARRTPATSSQPHPPPTRTSASPHHKQPLSKGLQQ